jgi:hypothetical protein
MFHIDLNGQAPGKIYQDFRFGSEAVRDAFYLVKLRGRRVGGHAPLDAHAYRPGVDGVWSSPALHADVSSSAKAERSAPTRTSRTLLEGTPAARRADLPPTATRPRPWRLRSEQIDDAPRRPGLGARGASTSSSRAALGVR